MKEKEELVHETSVFDMYEYAYSSIAGHNVKYTSYCGSQSQEFEIYFSRLQVS